MEPVVGAPSPQLRAETDGAGQRPGRAPMGVVRFASDPGGVAVGRNGVPTVSVQIPESAGDGFLEQWTTARPIRTGRSGPVAWSADGESMFCAFALPECAGYADATETAYSAAMALVEASGYRPCRIWHYISRLNEPNAAGLEVYRDFCVGRARALELLGRTLDMPAATVIGSAGGGIVCYLVAYRSGRQVNLENPRQVPAYHYPVQHGPRPPNFARATYLDQDDGGEFLFVSGTASILGHRTAHEGDVAAQARLALDNVACLIGPGNLRAHDVPGGHTLADLDAVKVYVRRPDDIPVVRDICSTALATDARVAFLQADVCRSDLLVELEGLVPRRTGTAA